MSIFRCFILVTENYRGARQAALDLAGSGIEVDLLIQEKISRDVLGVISKRPLIRINAWMREWFFSLALWRMVTCGFGKEVKVITTDHKTYRRCRRLEGVLRHQTLLLRVKEKRYTLSREGNSVGWQNCFGLPQS